ncbi:MAG: hypothetical protein KIT55_02065 [Nitrosomonas sp.]|nr:hypothetical protein [Nitrosomonas sp.]
MLYSQQDQHRHCEAQPPWQSSFSKDIALTPDYFHLFITLPRVDPPTMTVQDVFTSSQLTSTLLDCFAALAMTAAARICLLCKPTARHFVAA